jgi:hypothetical protein
MIVRFCLLLLAFAPLWSLDSANAAVEGAAIRSANQRSARAELKLIACGQFRERQAVNCVATAIRSFAADCGGCSFIAAVAPRAAPTITAAAKDLSNATTKEAAVSVVNRARSILRGLAATTSGEARRVYSRINRTFDTALSILNSKG